MTCIFRSQVKRKLFEERNENSTRCTDAATVLFNCKEQSQRQYSSKEQPVCGRTVAQKCFLGKARGVCKALLVTEWWSCQSPKRAGLSLVCSSVCFLC